MQYECADFIGSILIDFDEAGDFTAERRYKPYGELLAGTGTTYGWTGNTGSRVTLLQFAEQYNRRRHYSTKLKQWSTCDPLWPSESAYGYVRGGPLTWIDPSGFKMQICIWNQKMGLGIISRKHSRITSTLCQKMIGAGQISFGQSGIVLWLIGTDPYNNPKEWVCKTLDISEDVEQCICAHLKKLIWDNGANTGGKAGNLGISLPGKGRVKVGPPTPLGSNPYGGNSFKHGSIDCNSFVDDVLDLKDRCVDWLTRIMIRKIVRLWT